MAPVDNYLPITAYEISIADHSGSYAADAALCDGGSAAALADLACVIPMASLTGAPLSLPLGTLAAFKVRASNGRGSSLTSIANTAGVLAQTVPTAMAAPFTDPAQTGESQVHVEWTALSTAGATGGSAVTSYHLRWDGGAGDGSWQDVVGSSPASLATSIQLTSSITPGAVYTFSVRASNIHGWGAWSPAAAIKAAQPPHQMSAVTTSILSATGGVSLAWAPPSDGSDPIGRY